MKTGTVIFFDPYKGFGKILDDETKQEIFVHINDLLVQIYKGNKVKYQVESKDGTLCAYKVNPITP